MSNTNLTQGHKVLIAAGGQASPQITQGQKVLVMGGVGTPNVMQLHKVIIFSANASTPLEPRRKNSMSFIP